MSLSSVFQTARSGIAAATAQGDAVSHNIANSQTNGYKASRPVYATQASSTHGRENSRQAGIGVRVAGYAIDYSPGPLVALSLAESWGRESWVGAGESWVGDGLVELSNTDIGECLVDIVLASNQFLTNVGVIDTADNLLGELVELRRVGA